MLCPCPGFLCPHFFPGIPAAPALHKAWGWQPCPAQHCVPNPSPPAPTRSQSCGERAARRGGDGGGGWSSPCPASPGDSPALQLKGIIQIIPAWRRGSVAVMNSSEARRGRARTSLITVADACCLPRPSPSAKTPGSTRIPGDTTSPRCAVPVGTVHLADTAPGSAARPCTSHRDPHCPGCQHPKVQGAPFSMVKVDHHPHHTPHHPPAEIRSAVALERGAAVERGGWTCTSARPHFLQGQTPMGTGVWCHPTSGTGLQVAARGGRGER